MLDVVACLDGTGQFLIVGGGVLQLAQLGAVESDALGDTVDGFPADLTLQEQIYVDTLAGIDERAHPAASHGSWVAAFADIEVSVVAAVHDDIVGMGQVDASRGHEIDVADVGQRVNADGALFGQHGIHHDAIQPVQKRVIHTGAAVEEHINEFCQEGVLILWLYDVVAALGEVGAGVLCGRLQRGVDFAVIDIHLIMSAGRLVLEDEEETAGQRLAAALFTDEPDGGAGQLTAGLRGLCLQIGLKACDVLVGVGLPCDGFELQTHGCDLQPTGEGGDDLILLFRGAQQEVDGLDLKDLQIAAVCCLNDAVSYAFEWDEVLHVLAGRLSFAPFARGYLIFAVLICHGDNQSF